MHVVVVADTHLSGGVERLPAVVLEELGTADVILHAGDVTSLRALEELSLRAPTYAVLGNNDLALVGRLPEQLEIELAGLRIAMVHDSGDRRGREARLALAFPDAALVVFGHSHVPLDVVGVAQQRLFNPGSPTQRRRQPRASFGVLEIADGKLVAHELRYC